MPAEQEARVIANDALEHDGWLDPVDMMRLARAYLALEAELLAAQEREKAIASYRDELLHQAREDYRKLNQAASREKALREQYWTCAQDYARLRDFNEATKAAAAKLLAASPSETPTLTYQQACEEGWKPDHKEAARGLSEFGG